MLIGELLNDHCGGRDDLLELRVAEDHRKDLLPSGNRRSRSRLCGLGLGRRGIGIAAIAISGASRSSGGVEGREGGGVAHQRLHDAGAGNVLEQQLHNALAAEVQPIDLRRENLLRVDLQHRLHDGAGSVRAASIVPSLRDGDAAFRGGGALRVGVGLVLLGVGLRGGEGSGAGVDSLNGIGGGVKNGVHEVGELRGIAGEGNAADGASGQHCEQRAEGPRAGHVVDEALHALARLLDPRRQQLLARREAVAGAALLRRTELTKHVFHSAACAPTAVRREEAQVAVQRREDRLEDEARRGAVHEVAYLADEDVHERLRLRQVAAGADRLNDAAGARVTEDGHVSLQLFLELRQEAVGNRVEGVSRGLLVHRAVLEGTIDVGDSLGDRVEVAHRAVPILLEVSLLLAELSLRLRVHLAVAHLIPRAAHVAVNGGGLLSLLKSAVAVASAVVVVMRSAVLTGIVAIVVGVRHFFLLLCGLSNEIYLR